MGGGASKDLMTSSSLKAEPPTVMIPGNHRDGETHPMEVHMRNIHNANPDIKIHTVVSVDMDYDHDKAMTIPLGEVSDEQLLAEVARRNLDLHDKITDTLVKETYNLGEAIGFGASGEVLLATHKTNNTKFACKIVKKNSSINDAQSMSTEIEIMKRIRHRNVVSMYELYETPKCLWIILELVDAGDLLSHLATIDEHSEKLAARFIKQVFHGLHYLHSLGIVHRDIKLDNILLNHEGMIKLADFGLSALVRLGESGYDPDESKKRKSYRELHEMWGTREYFAPEIINQAYGPQADVWAVGCILFEILCGRHAFPHEPGEENQSHYARIKKGLLDFSKPGWSKVSNGAKELVKMLLTIDPTERLSASEALLHPWIKLSHFHAHGGASIDDEKDPHSNLPLVEAHQILKMRFNERIKKKKKIIHARDPVM